MRRIFIRTLVALLTFALGLCLALLWRMSKDGSPPSFARTDEAGITPQSIAEAGCFDADRRVLFDKRDYVEPDWSYEEFEARGKHQRELTQLLAPHIFPAPGLYHKGLCSPESRRISAKGEADLKWARERGQFVPWVRGWYRGSFTEVRPDEILYELSVGECNANSGPLEGGSSQLAVFADGQLRASVNTLNGTGVYGVQDTDGDGVDEFLLASFDPMMGWKMVTKLRLVSLKGGSLRVVHDFGVSCVYECLDEFCGKTVITIPVIYYTPGAAGRATRYQVDFYRARCEHDKGCDGWPRPDAWEYYKSGSLDE
jgi:hypothetical protein